MSQGGFQRVYPLGDGFIRAPARLLIEPVTAPYPLDISDIICLDQDPATYESEVQTITMTGSPAGGTFSLAFLSYSTTPLAWNCASTDVQSALEDLPGIGLGNVTCTGGPFPTTPIVVTFAGAMANLAQPVITVPTSLLALTGGTTPMVTVVETDQGFGLYDPVGAWTDLGSTKTGCRIERNNTETMIDVDQILTSLIALPDNWEMTVVTSFAETTLEILELTWEGSAITTDTTQTPNERHIGFGGPLSYAQNRLAVLAQKTIGPSAGRVKAHVFRSVTRSPVASQLMYDKTGPQQTIPFTFRAFADQNIGDPKTRFGEIFEQVAA